MILSDLGDLVTWLAYREKNLDEAVESVFASRKFEAWFTYQGMNDVLEDIRRKCEI